MKNNEIEKFFETKKAGESVVQISFKSRRSMKGIFIRQTDYTELSKKNLWRIVSESYIDSYKESNNKELAKIFNGTEFTRLQLS